MIKQYYSLAKPGIIYGNLITGAGGFLLASHHRPDVLSFVLTLLGLALVVASGCVFNNYLDRDIDALMERTKNRALVTGIISGRSALIYATTLGMMGVALLLFESPLAAFVALFGLFAYVILYSILSKRYSVHATLIGTISGAVPPVVGYCAISNALDLGALILFLALCAWQMPHALSIALYRIDDYAAASIPIFPIKQGILNTKKLITIYVFLFTAAALLLSITGYTGALYFLVMTIIGILWIILSASGFWTQDTKKWARRMFLYSLIVILVFCATMALDAVRV